MLSAPMTSSQLIYPLRYAWAWLAGGYLALVTIVLGSLLPGMPGPDFFAADKLVHLGIYLVLMLWFAGIYLPRRHLWVMFSLALLGVGLELVQEYSGLRNGDWRDVVANVAGLSAGLLLARFGLAGWCLAAENRLFGMRG